MEILGVALGIKIILLFFIFFFFVFTFVVFNQIRAMNNIINEATSSSLLEIIGFINILFAISLFILAIVIL